MIPNGTYPIAKIWPEIVCQTFDKYDVGMLLLYHPFIRSYPQHVFVCVLAKGVDEQQELLQLLSKQDF